MPKSFMYTARDYRTGKYHGSDELNPYVMLTRSGLSIKKIPVKPNGSCVKPVVMQPREERTRDRKQRAPRYRSMNYLSFVTRFYLYMRVPGLDIAGATPRETLRYLENLPIGSSKVRYVDDGDDEDDEVDIDDNDSLSSDDDNGTVTDYSENKDIDDLILRIADDINNNETTDVNSNALTSFKDATGDVSSQLNKNFHCTNTLLAESNCLPGSECPNDGPSDNVKETSVTQSKCNNITSIDSDRNDSSVEVGGRCARSDFEDSSSISETSENTSSDQTPALCDQPNPGDLKIHLIPSEAGQNLVKCPECDKTFSIVSAFTAHLKTHFKSKNMCYLCGKIFTRSWLLKGHIRTHTGEKPFPCPHSGCNKAFADKSNLRSHLMIHSTTKKNYNCERCGRAFAQKRYLHKHVQEVCRQPPV